MNLDVFKREFELRLERLEENIDSIIAHLTQTGVEDYASETYASLAFEQFHSSCSKQLDRILDKTESIYRFVVEDPKDTDEEEREPKAEEIPYSSKMLAMLSINSQQLACIDFCLSSSYTKLTGNCLERLEEARDYDISVYSYTDYLLAKSSEILDYSVQILEFFQDTSAKGVCQAETASLRDCRPHYYR